MNWAIIGRLSPWISTVGAATLVLIGVPEPEWWATGLLLVNAALQLVIRFFGTKA